MPTEIYYKVDFNVSKHSAVGATGSEMVVGLGFKLLSTSLLPTSIHMH